MQTFLLNEIDPADSLLLCATSRLAQSLRQKFDQAQLDQGETRWRSLNAQTVGQWLTALIEEIQLRTPELPEPLNNIVLDNFQEQLLWEEVIQESIGAGGALFDVSAMASTAAEAHALVCEWDVDLPTANTANETIQFGHWRRRFIERCEQNHWIDGVRQQQALLQMLETLEVTLPKVILFAGFDRHTPDEIRLQRLLAAKGRVIGELHSGQSHPAQPRVISYPDAAAEALAAALWAQATLDRNPRAQLGIVVPNLSGQRSLILDTLEDILAPGDLNAARAETPKPFNVSLGLPLAQAALVSTAFALLDILSRAHEVSQTRISQILRSPYWSDSATEADSRAHLEAQLRKSVAPKAPLKRFVGILLNRAQETGFPHQTLVLHVNAWRAQAERLKGHKMPSVWSQVLLEALKASGWTTGRPLSSHEYQTRQAFCEELRRLGRLDSLSGATDAATVIGHLKRLCRERIFQPKTIGRPPIQVLGLLEASGLNFDGLWVMGMTDNQWPPQARPNPLLPAAAQRRVRSPNASASVQMAFAEAIQHRLEQAALEVTFSWPRMDGASELRASPLLAQRRPAEEREAPVSPHWIAQALRQPCASLAPAIIDAMAPAVADGEKVRGGTWLLRAQAICPASAYYQFRLGASKLEEPQEGLDSRKRGTLVHDSLEVFWKSVRTAEALKAMCDDERIQAITHAVDTVLDAFDADKRQESLKPRFRQLERTRLIRLLDDWLSLELERTQNFTVLHCEKMTQVDIQGIRVRMMLDRVDQLKDGRLLVIDYKTGAAIDTRNWASDRITEPQLPIYAAIARPEEGPVAGVVFAKVLMDEPSCAGIGEEEALMPKVRAFNDHYGRRTFPESRFPDWQSVLNHWHDRIHAMATEVKAGDAGVRFADEKTLKYCDVRPLLRLSERREQLAAALAKRTEDSA